MTMQTAAEQHMTSDAKALLPVEAKGLTVLPTPTRIDLSGYRDIRIELARIYRLHDAGKLEDGTLKAKAYVLETMARIIKATETDERLEALERALGHRAKEQSRADRAKSVGRFGR